MDVTLLCQVLLLLSNFKIRFTFVLPKLLSQHDFNSLETQESELGKKGNRQSNSLFYLP